MFRSLLYKAPVWPVVWRFRLVYYWFTGDHGNLGFFAMLALPGLVLGSIIYLAYTHQPRVDLTRIDAARQRALELRCLAENIYFEARGEPLNGQYAVAEVTLNRLASPHFPNTICEVVHERRWDPIRRRLVAHFSWTEIDRLPPPAGPAWQQAMKVATAAYDEMHMPVVPGALFYHATSIRPYWAKTRRVVAKIGNHVFYR